MRQQFDLSLWLQDKSRKIVTRDGKPVRIVCWDAPGKNPIYGFVEGEDGITNWRKDGRFSNLIDNVDLFFAEEEEGLTKFEKMLRYVLECYSGHEFASESEIETLKLNAKSLHDLARKELLKDLPELEKTKDVIDPRLPPEEPASDDLNREIGKYTTNHLLKKRNHSTGVYHLTQKDCDDIAHHFAEWQKEQMIKDSVNGIMDCDETWDMNIQYREPYIQGYGQAMRDFLEKACTFLKNRTMPELCLDSESTELVDDFVEQFKNYMQDEM